ncbi:Zinc finger DNA binding protein [Operophtera brumata]|uniref:Zinc finger DNA binding protein n=1 Tax=Operophtera brumata TaxID=104452 RepID=A0A0L7LCV3_OPEBR|nr:Zinc finger DNA binding protein [Operophtera brumata]
MKRSRLIPEQCMRVADLVEKTTVINQLKNENEKLHGTVHDLSSRLNTVELHMRECNIEINGIPENRSENLIDTVVKLTKSVDSPLEVGDIQHVTRIAKLNRDSDKPRAVIVKLRSPIQRDGVLAAVFKHNKENKEEKLNTHHLGIGGTRKPVFVSEHLTPANKSLHAAARKRAKDMSYKLIRYSHVRFSLSLSNDKALESLTKGYD